MKSIRFWTIRHPGTLELLIFDNRIDAEKYYKGFNPITPLSELREINWDRVRNQYANEIFMSALIDNYGWEIIERLVTKQLKGEDGS